ncbi:hypothetical protein HDK64DRAFT_329731 [Phyllosticta capitalensis]
MGSPGYQQTTTYKVSHRSDGDESHVPHDETVYSQEPPPAKWLMYLARGFMNRGGIPLSPGVVYAFDALPNGYTVWAKRRNNGHIDRYIYGHPHHHRLDAPSKFIDHFYRLQTYDPDSNTDCPCETCARPPVNMPPTTRKMKASSAASKPTQPIQPTQPAAESAKPAFGPPPPPSVPKPLKPLPKRAPHGPHQYNKSDPEGPMPGFHCKWCPPSSVMNYCGICNRLFEAPEQERIWLEITTQSMAYGVAPLGDSPIEIIRRTALHPSGTRRISWPDYCKNDFDSTRRQK